jgi:hypothetical protein
LKRVKVARDLHFSKDMFFQTKGKNLIEYLGIFHLLTENLQILLIIQMYSYKRTSHITKMATWNEFYAFIGSIGKKEQFVAIWSRLPRSYDKVGQGVRHGTLKGKPLW